MLNLFSYRALLYVIHTFLLLRLVLCNLKPLEDSNTVNFSHQLLFSQCKLLEVANNSAKRLSLVWMV